MIMGADLYINTLYEPHNGKWQRRFDQAVERCKKLSPDTEEHKQAQAEVEQAYQKTHERGYFRDPYNNNDLLWKFGLSWWEDVIPMLDAGGDLSPAQAKELLGMLQENQEQFRANLAKMPPEERRYFLDRYADLQKFLNEAIELDAPIHASL
jgi:DNA-directed RNA polymerase specialized sigma24 family protein